MWYAVKSSEEDVTELCTIRHDNQPMLLEHSLSFEEKKSNTFFHVHPVHPVQKAGYSNSQYIESCQTCTHKPTDVQTDGRNRKNLLTLSILNCLTAQ